MDRGLNRQLVAPLAEHRALTRQVAPLDLLGVRLIEGESGSGSDDGGGDSGGTGDDDGDGQDDDHDGDNGQDDDGDDDGDSGGTGFGDLPAKTQAEIKRLRRDNKNRRDSDKKFREGLADLLGFTPDGKPKQSEPTERETQLARENRQHRVERAAEKAIRKAGGDVDAVMDSNGFTGQLSDLDPDDDGFADELDSLAKKTVTSSDRFKASRPRQGGGTREHGDGGPKERPKNLRDAFGRRNTK